MQYRQLGRSGMDVSVIAMGCWAISGGSTWGEQDTGLIQPTVEAAIESGITLFDTAPNYGDSETLMGKALRPHRDRVIIATKIRPQMLRRQDVRRSCEASLERLQTDRIDLLQIHWPNHQVPFSETLEALARLRQEGKIRAIGVSNFGPIDLIDAMAVERFDSNQLAYSLLARAIEFNVVPLCVQHEFSILCYSPLAQGMLTGKFRRADEVPEGRARTRHFDAARHAQAAHGGTGCEAETFDAIAQVRAVAAEMGEPMADVALAWCLHQPGVTSVLAGARSPEQARENARAGELRLPPAIVARLNAATASLKEILGPNCDMWFPASRSRMR